MQPREISISLKIAQSRLIPTFDSIKRGVERKEGSGEGGRNFRCYPDGKRTKKINEAVIFRNSAMGFNDCPDEERSEIRITCAVCSMNRDVSTIALIKKGMKANKVIITSYFSCLFQHLSPKRDRKVILRSIDTIVHLVSTVSKKNRSET